MPLPIARDVEAVMVIYFICSGLLLSGRILEMQLLKALKKIKSHLTPGSGFQETNKVLK